MNKFHKTILATMVVAAMPLIAATDNTIYVTTTTDEDGENNSACSLREAIKASTTKKAYGGCNAGLVSVTDTIKLKEGVYTLTHGPLIIGSNVNITGVEPTAYDHPDAVTDIYPARTALKTTIQGSGTTIFDSTVSRNSINLTNVILQGGKTAGNGGAIHAGGAVTLNRVQILDSTAQGSGGAVYLEGANTSLSVADSLFQNNSAAVQGAVIGMSCIDNVSWTVRSINLDRSALVGNIAPTSKNLIEYCGTPTASVTNSTIANNQTAGTGSIIQYTHDQKNGIDVLHPNSSLSLVSNTIVRNTSGTTLLYDNVGRLGLSHNVLAYNAGGPSCRYSLGDASTLTSSNVTASFNAVKKTGINGGLEDVCQLPQNVYVNGNDHTVDLSGVAFDSVLYGMQAPSESNGFLPVFLPKLNNGVKLIDAGAQDSCASYDQRGLNRHITSFTSDVSALSSPNPCDIGSVEIGQLRVVNIGNAANTSYVTAINNYQTNVDTYTNALKDSTTPTDFISYYKMRLATEQRNLTEIQNPNTARYRQVYVSILPDSVQQEQLNDTGSSFVKFLTATDEFNAAQYDVSTEALGRGTAEFMLTRDKDAALTRARNGDRTLIDTSLASQIKCTWNPTLKQVMISHIEANPQLPYQTVAGEFEYCRFTVKMKGDNAPSATGYIQAKIQNIAPIAKDDTFIVKYGSDQRIAMDLLTNDSDDGDGKPGIDGYPALQTPFFKDSTTGRFANIKITNGRPVYDKNGLVIKGAVRPEGGLGTLQFEYEQPCPDSSSTRPEQTCYGGKLVYTADNTFSPFNDSFKYKVLDNDLVESNEATVTITNTATTTDDTRPHGGGGAVGLFGVLGLATLAGLRRRMSK